MADRKRKAAAADEDSDHAASAADKIAGLLALIATQGMETDEAAIKLDAIGFSAREISLLLGVSSSYVSVAKHRRSKKPKKKGHRKETKKNA
jgi:hypothetical protein